MKKAPMANSSSEPALIRKPLLFSEHFRIRPEELDAFGALDPILNYDTPLCFDPQLLRRSSHEEMKRGWRHYISHFEKIFDLLRSRPEQKAMELLKFPEVRATCLGYGKKGTRGTGIGPGLGNQILEMANHLVKIDAMEPMIFSAIRLFGEQIGPDRISDMTAGIITIELFEYTSKIAKHLAIPTSSAKLNIIGDDRYDHYFDLPINPTSPNEPVLMCPKDVLCALPLVQEWQNVAAAINANEHLRERVNKDIGAIYWSDKMNKGELRERVTKSRASCEAFLAAVCAAPPRPYLDEEDPDGHVVWKRRGSAIARNNELDLRSLKTPTFENARDALVLIVEKFRQLIRGRVIYDDFWHKVNAGGERTKHPRTKLFAQRFFFAIADTYLQNNGALFCAETPIDGGVVDFRASDGPLLVRVDVRLSSGNDNSRAYEALCDSLWEENIRTYGIFILIDVGDLGTVDEEIKRSKGFRERFNKPVANFEMINRPG